MRASAIKILAVIVSLAFVGCTAEELLARAGRSSGSSSRSYSRSSSYSSSSRSSSSSSRSSYSSSRSSSSSSYSRSSSSSSYSRSSGYSGSSNYSRSSSYSGSSSYSRNYSSRPSSYSSSGYQSAAYVYTKPRPTRPIRKTFFGVSEPPESYACDYSPPAARDSFFGFDPKQDGYSRDSYGSGYGEGGKYSSPQLSTVDWIIGLTLWYFILRTIWRVFKYLTGCAGSAVMAGYHMIAGSPVVPGSSSAAVAARPARGRARTPSPPPVRPDDRVLRERISDVFMRVQQAWAEQNPKVDLGFATDKLIRKHTADLEKMAADGEKNIINRIEILGVEIVSCDERAGRMAADINASMIDYYIKTDSLEIIDGDPAEPSEFTERWHFRLEGGQWLLDEIEDLE